MPLKRIHYASDQFVAKRVKLVGSVQRQDHHRGRDLRARERGTIPALSRSCFLDIASGYGEF